MQNDNFITRFDSWLLDRVFQPAVNYLPEKFPPRELGSSLLLGSVVSSAVCIILMALSINIGFESYVYNILGLCVQTAFYVGISRMARSIRPGYMNPLRLMLSGFRPITILFTIFYVYQGTIVPNILAKAFWFNSLSCVVYVVGLYVVSCNHPPKKQKQTARSPLLRQAGHS